MYLLTLQYMFFLTLFLELLLVNNLLQAKFIHNEGINLGKIVRCRNNTKTQRLFFFLRIFSIPWGGIQSKSFQLCSFQLIKNKTNQTFKIIFLQETFEPKMQYKNYYTVCPRKYTLKIDCIIVSKWRCFSDFFQSFQFYMLHPLPRSSQRILRFHLEILTFPIKTLVNIQKR